MIERNAAPFQVRAQGLRRWEDIAPAGAFSGFATMPDEPAGTSNDYGQVRKGSWRQADVKRAIAAAEQAGLASYRIEISPDGTITIVVGEPS